MTDIDDLELANAGETGTDPGTDPDTDPDIDPDPDPNESGDPPQTDPVDPTPTPEDPPGHCFEEIPPIAQIPEGGPGGED